jgi:hypothetical protein
MTFATDFVVQPKTGDDAPVNIEESSGNVVADLGLKNPEELLAMASLVQPIHFQRRTSPTHNGLRRGRKSIDHKSAPCRGIR